LKPITKEMKEKIVEIKSRAEQLLKEWNYPNEHYIEATGMLMVCDELLTALKSESEPRGETADDHELSVEYWAGRLMGYDQAWEVADEIVEAIGRRMEEYKNTPDLRGELKNFNTWMCGHQYDGIIPTIDRCIDEYLQSRTNKNK